MESLSLENNKNNFLTASKKVIFVLSTYLLVLMPAYANQISENSENTAPLIYSITPQFIQQGQITTSVVTGINLNSSVTGVIGGGVYGVVLKEDPSGTSLTVQFAAGPTSELGEKEFFIRTQDGQEARFPIKVIQSGAPSIESIYPNSATPGSTVLLYLSGMGLTNPVVSTTSDKLFVNSYRATIDGSVLYLSISLTPDIVPGAYQIFVNTIGGQAQGDFIASSTENSDENSSFSVDPGSPWVNSIERVPSSPNQIILKGSMFDPDPAKNIVTILQNNDGTVTGHQIEVASSNNNELVINLPDDITSDSISFAVSSADGKPSNIKTVDLNSLLSTTQDSTTTKDPNNKSNDTTTTGGQPIIGGNVVISENNQGSNHHKTDSTQTDTNKQNETTVSKNPSDLKTIEIVEGQENPTLSQNIKNLTQYLINTAPSEVTPTLSETKDPARLISKIEENKQIKSQAELVTLALNEAKQNQQLHQSVVKVESLKTKVDELEKLLSQEKQKNSPNPRKLATYQELLNDAHAESRSQTFALLNNLLKYKPQLKNLLSQRPFDLAAIQPNIPKDSVILQYVPTEEGIIIFIVDNNNIKVRINKTISRDILNREIQAYRQLFENEIEKIRLTGRVTPIVSWKNDNSTTYKKEIQPLKEKSVFLYNALIEPVEKDISNKKIIAVIANGWLRYLPFQSLSKLTSDGDLKFLISDKSIVYLDSVISINNNTLHNISSMAAITVLANPDGSLSGADKEAEIISKLFGKSVIALAKKPFNILLINQLAKNADILHLATHGHLDSVNIDSSFLVSGKKQIGKSSVQEKLFLKDIYDLNLQNSKLVVLSGCDTGKLGSLLNEPDDIVGSLASAFRVAGANSILASLWKAHDEATKIIMQNFYENLKAGVNKAESLRRAELKVKENPRYGHPLFWSLFNLIGDWR